MIPPTRPDETDALPPTFGVFNDSYQRKKAAATGTDVAQCRSLAGSVESEKNINQQPKEKSHMLWTILVILLVLWLLGLVSGYTVGGFVHLLLVLALVIFVINLLTGRRTV